MFLGLMAGGVLWLWLPWLHWGVPLFVWLLVAGVFFQSFMEFESQRKIVDAEWEEKRRAKRERK